MGLWSAGSGMIIWLAGLKGIPKHAAETRAVVKAHIRSTVVADLHFQGHRTHVGEQLNAAKVKAQLLDLAFLEHNVLARDWIVLAHFQLLSRGAGVLLFYIEVAGVSRAYHLDQYASWLRHGSLPSKFLHRTLLRL